MPATPASVERTRARIRDAAVELFTRQGFHGTSVREIAKLAGVALGSVYTHHPTKEALFAEVLDRFERGYNGPDTPITRALLSFASLEDLEALGEASRETVRRYADYIRLIYVDVVELEGEHIGRLFGRMRERFEAALGPRLEAMRARGELGEVDGIAGLMTVVIAFFYLFNVEHIFGVGKLYGVPDREAIRTIATVFREGMRPRRAEGL